MEGKLKRIRFRKDGKIDFEIETEDGKRAIAAGCSLHINLAEQEQLTLIRTTDLTD